MGVLSEYCASWTSPNSAQKNSEARPHIEETAPRKPHANANSPVIVACPAAVAPGMHATSAG